MHAILNHLDDIELTEGSILHKFSQDTKDMTPEERKARHRRRMAKKRERQGPGSLVLHMDMEEEIKGVVAEMKAREQAKAEARQVKEGDYYRVLGLKKTAKPGSCWQNEAQ